MKTTSWICWLLAVCICLSEAKNKIRRPLTPSYGSTLVLKKPRPINQRISMGNTIHIGGSLSHQRIPYKHVNYRIRRPIYNVLSTNWKNQIPMRAISTPNNRAILPQRAPIKEFYSINKVPEYSPEYKPELSVLPSTHRGSVDDDKGPIHTIPAPNLSPADKPYNTGHNAEDIANHRPYSSDLNFHNPMQNSRRITFGLATISDNLPSQRTATSLIPSQHQYQVTESNDVTLKEYPTFQPTTFQPQDLDITKLYSIIINNPQPQSNELFASHPVNSDTSIIDSNLQFGQSNVPMNLQTNLHGSLNIGFPSTVIQQTPYTIAQQIPTDLHVGHPAPAGPPLSATQLYDLLNNFPHKLAERYATDQHQFGQTLEPDVATSFSQPQMHSFNYDEQTNQLQQRQQQQILLDQNYASESVTADYNLDSKSPLDIRKQNDNARSSEEFIYPIDGDEQSENNIEYEETIDQRNPETYFDKVPHNVISTRFYTTLPNREAAEKLAALAAAGNVNSRLIGQLRKQEKNMREDEPMPLNHKNDDAITGQHVESQIDDDQRQEYNKSKSSQNSQQHHKQNHRVQSDEKLPLQITVSDESDYVMNNDDRSDVRKDDVVDMEYEYENEDGEIENTQSATLFNGKTTSRDNNFHISEFGSRLHS
ncbi:hypothetical protein P5V15_009933 [Pogonomyrmex californicus]